MNDPSKSTVKIRSKEEVVEALAVTYLLLEHPCDDEEENRSVQKLADVLLWVCGDNEGPFAKFMSKAGPKIRQFRTVKEMEQNETTE